MIEAAYSEFNVLWEDLSKVHFPGGEELTTQALHAFVGALRLSKVASACCGPTQMTRSSAQLRVVLLACLLAAQSTWKYINRI